MKNLLKTIGILALGLFATFASAKDVFDFKMTLKVPRVYNNERSLGFRKYQKQIIKGEMVFDYDQDGSLTNVQFRNVYNKTHKLSSGKNVTYDTKIDPDVMYPRFVAIGDNRKRKFNVPSVCFFLVAEPSYNIGQLDEDNALYLMVSGNGLLHPRGYVRKLSGYVSGTIGCGCAAYGHISPTRVLWFWGASDQVDDVAAVFGTWRARFNKKKSDR